MAHPKKTRRKNMVRKKLLNPQRARRIEGSFAFIERRFLRHGFWIEMTHHELLLYLFLVLVADPQGLSYYGYDKLLSLLKLSVDEYVAARNGLIQKDLIAFDGTLFQVLSLPDHPVRKPETLLPPRRDAAGLGQILAGILGGKP
jgi:hypothetical protein